MSLRLCLLWHMHQPDYRDPRRSGHAVMPWTRLHAARDYVDMLELATRHPGVHTTFNYVPVLLDQLIDVANGGSDPLLDACSRDPGELSRDDVARLLPALLEVHPEHAVNASARYRELAELVEGAGGPATAARQLDRQGLLDLQVHFHLAWTGPLLRREPEIAALIAQDRDFSVEQRDALLARHRRLAGEVIPRIEELWAAGSVEVSTTPYYHPILPLLCDLSAAERARPGCSVEGIPFVWPEDAQLQIERGLARCEELLGRRPVGMWPSEGAISAQALRLLAGAGVQWIASDEQVLRKTLPDAAPDMHLQAWRAPGGPVLVLRDTALSDRIGFSYASWDTDEAVADFLTQLRALAARTDEPDPIVGVFLDGENAWEHYAGLGEPFLDALYAALAEAEDIQVLTLSEALARGPLPRPVDRGLRPGSWIRGDLDTWAGHPEKNHAWRLLSGARGAFHEHGARVPADDGDLAREMLLRAEGSDWFWWLGDDHHTDWLSEFESLFRAYLRRVYELLQLEPPAGLGEPIPASRGRDDVQGPELPFAPISPPVDGTGLPHPAWAGSGVLRPSASSGTMAASAPRVGPLRWGCDPDYLYLRLDPPRGASDFLRDAEIRVRVGGDGSTRTIHWSGGRMDVDAGRAVLSRTWEAALRWAALPASPQLRLAVEVLHADGGHDRLPRLGWLPVQRPSDDFALRHWST